MSEFVRKDIKVGIAVPIYESVHATVYANHMQIISNWSRLLCETALLTAHGNPTADARSALAEASLEQKCTHTFFMASDCVIPIHTLPRLVGHHGIDIVSGVICSTAPMFEQIGGILVNGEYATLNLPLDGKIYEVDWCPLGCCLVKNDWFLKIGRPYFLDESHDLGRMRIRQNKRHNITFSERAKRAGAKIHIDTGVFVVHGKGSLKIAPNSETGKGRVEIRP